MKDKIGKVEISEGKKRIDGEAEIFTTQGKNEKAEDKKKQNDENFTTNVIRQRGKTWKKEHQRRRK